MLVIQPYHLRELDQLGCLVDFHFRLKSGVAFSRRVQQLSLSLDRRFGGTLIVTSTDSRRFEASSSRGHRSSLDCIYRDRHSSSAWVETSCHFQPAVCGRSLTSLGMDVSREANFQGFGIMDRSSRLTALHVCSFSSASKTCSRKNPCNGSEGDKRQGSVQLPWLSSAVPNPNSRSTAIQ